jgi:hypothetical protein
MIGTAYDDNITLSKVASTTSTSRQYRTTAERLAAIWNIGLETARKTVQVTTQKGIRTTTIPIEQRFRTRQAQDISNWEADMAGFTQIHFSLVSLRLMVTAWPKYILMTLLLLEFIL